MCPRKNDKSPAPLSRELAAPVLRSASSVLGTRPSASSPWLCLAPRGAGHQGFLFLSPNPPLCVADVVLSGHGPEDSPTSSHLALRAGSPCQSVSSQGLRPLPLSPCWGLRAPGPTPLTPGFLQTRDFMPGGASVGEQELAVTSPVSAELSLQQE